MRLTEKQAEIIRDGVIKHFGEKSVVYLFGSRVDDTKKGGDIDLLIEADYSPKDMLMKKINLLTDLHFKLGERKIDIVTFNSRADIAERPIIVEEALSTGIRL
jgi:predicted nucleotidyltransferase